MREPERKGERIVGQGNDVMFDRLAPGGGVEVTCRLEAGRAFLEWKLHFAGQVDQLKESMVRSGAVRITLTDAQGNTALECRQFPGEEEPLRAILLQPKLWQGVGNPCLYHMEAVLTDETGRCLDRVCRKLPLRMLAQTEAGECRRLLLNGEELEVRGVRYRLPDTRISASARPVENGGVEQGTDSMIAERGRPGDSRPPAEGFATGDNLESVERLAAEGKSESVDRMKREAGRIKGFSAELQIRLLRDFHLLLELGANCIFWDSRGEGQEEQAIAREAERSFLQLCDRFGFLVFCRDKKNAGYVWPQAPDRIRLCDPAEIPSLRGGAEALLLPDGQRPASLYYRYRAKWSREPFVYIVPESIKRTESGNYTALCYSSCDRVALYSDGALFEFQKGSGEFWFREIPAKSPCIMLTAEGEGCSQSLSVHKSFAAQGKGAIYH